MATQPQAPPVDGNGNAVPMFGAEFGDMITLLLTVASGVSTVKLSNAVGYPKNPTVTQWVLQNFNSGATEKFFVSGSDVAAAQGLLLTAGTVGPANIPGTLGLLSDPGQTFIRQDSGGPLVVQLTLFGKNLR